MRVDLTPANWSGHTRAQIGAVIAYAIEALPVAELYVTRHKLIVETDTRPNPKKLKALRSALVKLGPFPRDA